MKYQCIPDTYNKRKIEEKGFSDLEFENLQKKYIESFEKWLMQKIDLSNINQCIANCKSSIPVMEDKEYNIYHKNSSLGNDYLYLRNNVHIENLSEQELSELYNSILAEESLAEEFLHKTIAKVLYENGDATYYGIPSPESEVPSKSIVLEFAYDQKKCNSIEQVINIRNSFAEIQKEIIESNRNNSDFPIFLLMYNGIPDLFRESMMRKESGKESIVK